MKNQYLFLILLLTSFFATKSQNRIAYREAQLVRTPSYQLDGTAYIEELDNGTFQFRLSSDFFTDPGPDIQILLVNNTGFSTPVDTTGNEFVADIGNDGSGISHFNGAYTVNLGNNLSSLSDFNHVVFVCVGFGNIAWGNGSFGPEIQDCSNFNTEIAATLGDNTSLLSVVSGDTYQWLDCNNNSMKVGNETNINFEPSSTGSFAVEVTKNGCIDTSDCFEVITVGVADINSISNNVNIYPNPTSKEINLEVIGLTNYTIQVTNSNGQVIVEQSNLNNMNKFKVDLSGLKGLYFITVKSNEGSTTFKVVKK